LPHDALLVMKNYAYVHDKIGQIYQDGFSQQALTEQLEGKTEPEQEEVRRQMQRESQLVTAGQFDADAKPLRLIEFGTKPSQHAQAEIKFDIAPQPLFHKNFNLLESSLQDYLLQGYKIYILADSQKQTDRLRDIFDSQTDVSDTGRRTSLSSMTTERIPFTPVGKTLHEGFADNKLRVCLFTDHQIFDRFHKYNLKSDLARGGKVALTMK